MDKISVIVPVYNAENYINRCVDSILNQTHKDIEVILVNDGSKDNSLEILREYEQKDSRVKVIDQENKGVAVARDVGLKNAIGEYIAFCDSDDSYEPDFLQLLYKNLINYGADMSLCRARLFKNEEPSILNESDSVLIWDRHQAINAFLDQKLLNGVLWNKLIKRELFENFDFDKSFYWLEDSHAIWKILQKCNKVVRIDKAKYNFFTHSNSLCAQKYSEKRALSTLRFWDIVIDDCLKAENQKHLEKAKISRFLFLYSELRLMLKDGYKKTQDIKKIQRIMKENAFIGLAFVKGFAKIFAVICMFSLPIAKGIRKIF